MKKIIILALFLVNILFTLPAFAENFYIKNYDVNLNVTETKSVYAKENIDVFFTTPSHGIYRTISVKRGGRIGRVWAKGHYDVDFGNTSKKIKIGNPNRYVQGDKHYNIEYDYFINDGKDEFYFNIIGTQWNTDILNSTFTIVMPKDVDANKVGLSIGKKGTKGFKDIAIYSVEGNVIKGKILKPLPPNNGITIRIEVPEDYFIQDGVSKINKHFKQITIFLMIFFTFISFMIWFIYGRDKHITPVVSFYPPQGLNSAEIGIIYDEQINTKQIVSLIYYLATKGYIKIINDKNNFKILKLKEYDGINKNEKKLMNSLFSDKNKSDITNIQVADLFTVIKDYAQNFNNQQYEKSDSNTVTELELKYSRGFYKDIQDIEKDFKNFRNQIFNLASLGFGKNFIMVVSLILVCFLVTYTLAGYTFACFTEGFILGLFPIIGISVVASVLPKADWLSKIFMLVWGTGFIGIPSFMLWESGIISFDEMPVLVLGVICAIIIGICWHNLPQWTETARILRGQILGFRKFLQVAEQSRIEQLMRENPNYCTDLIPYAYVLDVTDTWMKKFENLIDNPAWYSGEFNHHSFSHISSNLHSYSSPSTSNGGCSSSSSGGGGGCSGGGHGGGGGGSW